MTTPPDAADPLQTAIAHHRRGELDAAEAIYAELLRHAPRRPDALNFMGMLQLQRGEPARALELLKTASTIAPRQPAVWNNLGNALLSLDKLPEAEKAFRRSLALAESAEALTNIARIQRRRRDWARSGAACRRALALAPKSGEAWHYLSLALPRLFHTAACLGASVEACCSSSSARPGCPRCSRSMPMKLSASGRRGSRRSSSA